eukprot:gb/GECG01004045.1/.p1 GENE.gb/GECG01004045.1/~~gb/GECG01004045.1/.p1  ORF type:complete len:139 (+),score=15.05 gb/GECG01004045.1/:1-417(+)
MVGLLKLTETGELQGELREAAKEVPMLSKPQPWTVLPIHSKSLRILWNSPPIKASYKKKHDGGFFDLFRRMSDKDSLDNTIPGWFTISPLMAGSCAESSKRRGRNHYLDLFPLQSTIPQSLQCHQTLIVLVYQSMMFA